MNETTRSRNVLRNELWPLKYANKNPLIECPPMSAEGAAKMLREFDEAFPAVAAMCKMRKQQ